MRRFKFPLEMVMRVRGHREATARRELADALAAQAAARSAVDRARTALALAEGHLRAAETAVALRGAAAVVEFRRNRLREAADRLHRAQRHAEESWARFLLARRERRAIERLRERRLIALRQEEARRDQMVFDDLAIVRHTRRKP